MVRSLLVPILIHPFLRGTFQFKRWLQFSKFKKKSYILNLYGRWPLSGLMRTMAMLFVWSRRTPFPRCYQHGLRKLLYLVVRIQRHYWNRRNLSRLAHSPFSKDRCSSFSDWEFLTCYILERLRFQRIRWVHASSKLVWFSTEIGVFEYLFAKSGEKVKLNILFFTATISWYFSIGLTNCVFVWTRC